MRRFLIVLSVLLVVVVGLTGAAWLWARPDDPAEFYRSGVAEGAPGT